jgi:hypothetical protein
VDGLSRYDRATVGLWRGGHAAVRRVRGRPLAEAAAHAVLAGLRRYADVPALLAAYEASPATGADLAMVGSLVDAPTAETRLVVRDAAFYLRWRELGGGP